MIKHIRLFLLLFLPLSVHAQFVMPETERVLLPITVQDAGGAFGTRWSTDATIFMDAAAPPLVFPLAGCSSPCDNPFGPTSRHMFRFGFFATGAGDTTGSLLYVERRGADVVSLALTLRNTADDSGVSLPVVREREFFTERFQLLDVPNPGPSRRIALRIYAIDPSLLGAVRVRIFRPGTEEMISDRTYELSVVQRYYSTASFSVPIRPPVAEVHYWETLTSPGERLRFEVEPLTPGLRIWAFISITDNTTQRVSLRVP